MRVIPINPHARRGHNEERGKDYLVHRIEDKIVKNHIKWLRELGYGVELKKAA
tara:strand:+ start:264 stop:422 length:159 start_codon:yes stop_codon:yes gene_type:complete